MSKWESYQFANRLKLGNHWLQVILILSLILGIGLKYFIDRKGVGVCS